MEISKYIYLEIQKGLTVLDCNTKNYNLLENIERDEDGPK